MISRPDLIGSGSPDWIEICQLTTEPEIPSSHVYMEAQIFSPDSSWFLLHRSAYPHTPGVQRDDPDHQYLLCNLEDHCELTPIITECHATAPSVSPDGKTIYYFVDDTTINGGVLTLKCVRPDGSGRETMAVIDAPFPETGTQPSMIYPLSSMSSDGERIAMPAFLGDEDPANRDNGVLIFDVKKGTVDRVILLSEDWINIHPQYTRASGKEESHLLMIQHNHGGTRKVDGTIEHLTRPPGADIHVIRDDEPDSWWTLPWGRDGIERCQGHHCWRGRSAEWAITSTVNKEQGEELIESSPIRSREHAGNKTPGGQRNNLTREIREPAFYHFATDAAGKRIIMDSSHDGGNLYLADLGEPGRDPLKNFTFLLDSRSNLKRHGANSHTHPFLSPDGKYGFFNSIETGITQAYMIKLLLTGDTL